ncbi:60S ribosomal protein L23a-like [Fukomys damarensis]|uniref:60S ribosomal protein L23a n=1 Tax=Fukomys damarensis TaxID=885580 RepID=A0A091E0Y3_FUKDA|nr:60S ribosomal protein L23a-like [Fukomys damarensis]KFO37012.1 60S ribosomal protein L23a [Fukomys damarensis]
MVPKEKGEAPAPPKAEAKVKAVKAKKAVLRGIHSHKKKICTSPTFHSPKTGRLWWPKYPRESSPRRNKLDHCAIIKFPQPESAVQKTEGNNTPVFTVGGEASRRQIKRAVKELCDVAMAKVNTPVRPAAEKKVYV